MNSNSEPVTHNTTPLTLPLPPIKELFSKSWSVFTKSLLNLFFLKVLVFLTQILSLVVAGVIVFITVFGWGKTLPGSPQQFLSFFKPSLLLPLGGTLGGLFVVGGVIGLISTIASVLFVANAERPQPFGKTVKQSFSLIIPLFVTSFFVFFITIGGYFLFLIPGLLIGFFLMFTSYEVILAGKKLKEAAQGSLRLVSGHFGEVLIRQLILFFLYVFLMIFLPNLIRKIEPGTGFILVGLSFINNLLIGWFGLAYSVTLYKQAKNATDETKPASLKWLVGISLVGWLLAATAIYATYRLVTSKKGQTFIKNLVKEIVQETRKNYPPPFYTSYEVNKLARDTFLKVNQYRQQNEISPLKEDGKLCAYATRRLDQLTEKGSFDDNRGLYEDFANPTLNYAYFQGYASINQYLWPLMKKETTADEIVGSWLKTDQTNNKYNIINKDFTHGCVRANRQWLVFIIAREKGSQEGQKGINQLSCFPYQIREGEFASNKCYSKKDYDDLLYYLQHYQSATIKYQAAEAKIRITCTGSDFFKASCEEAQREKQQGETEIGNYREIIRQIINRGR